MTTGTNLMQQALLHPRQRHNNVGQGSAQPSVLVGVGWALQSAGGQTKRTQSRQATGFGLVPCRSPRLEVVAWSRAHGTGESEELHRARDPGGWSAVGRWRQSAAPEAVTPSPRPWGAVGYQGVEVWSGGRPAGRQKQARCQS